MTLRSDASDFTEEAYTRLIGMARERYAFEPFGTASNAKHVLWRHDVDLSVHRASVLARIEAEQGVQATYFLWPHSEFYNLWDAAVVREVREIQARGHWIGLHFDAGFYPAFQNEAALEEKIAEERQFIEGIAEAPVRCFSFHDPEEGGMLSFDRDEMAGMVNAYGRRLRNGYKYVSDSNGYWRFDNLFEVVEEAVPDRLHVLTHPGWWVDKAMAPRRRVERCVEGRAAATMAWYDQTLKDAGRKNVR